MKLRVRVGTWLRTGKAAIVVSELLQALLLCSALAKHSASSTQVALSLALTVLADGLEQQRFSVGQQYSVMKHPPLVLSASALL